jgi:hypothetical protein
LSITSSSFNLIQAFYLFRMTSSGNNDAAMQPSITVGAEEQEGDFLSTMKTFDFPIIDDDPELDLPSQVTNVSEKICLMTRAISP